jgi:excisionase family DNA binding protein
MDSTISGYLPRLRYINQPDAVAAVPDRLVPIKHVADVTRRHQRTVEDWISKGNLTPYSPDGRRILLDMDEVESALKTNPHMRDGRRPRFANIVRIDAVAKPGADS